MSLQEAKAKLHAAQARYHAVVHTAPIAEVQTASQAVKEARAALNALLQVGATPCPDCGTLPHVMEQPKGKAGVEYEVGCTSPSCAGAFRHTDGTAREHRVRGGLLPKHAIEAWNEGPDFWLICTHPERLKALEEAEAKARDAAEKAAKGGAR